MPSKHKEVIKTGSVRVRGRRLQCIRQRCAAACLDVMMAEKLTSGRKKEGKHGTCPGGLGACDHARKPCCASAQRSSIARQFAAAVARQRLPLQ